MAKEKLVVGETVTAASMSGLRRDGVEMQKAWLIQRLDMPMPGHRENPFEFGAGYRRGGLSKKAYDAVNKIFGFDYMVAAEYEWGAIPASLSAIWEMGKKKELAVGELKLGEGSVFYLCDAGMEKGVREVIEKVAHGGISTRDYVGLKDALREKKRQPGDQAGWLELDNHFMFFVDREMFEKSAKLFGIDLSSHPRLPDKRSLR